MAKQLRVVCADGPGDAIESFRHWQAGVDHPGVTHVTFSGQLYAVCREMNASLFLMSENSRIDTLTAGGFRIEHRGNASLGKRGWAYHWREIVYAFTVIITVLRWRADVLITNGRPYPFLLGVLGLFRVRTVLTLHCVLWPKFGRMSRTRRVLERLSRSSYRRRSAAILCVSQDIKDQVAQVAGGVTAPMVDFLPFYRSVTFAGVRDPVHGARPFRVMFAGRIEVDKGVLAVVAMAKSILAKGRRDVCFELCGTGSAVEAVAEAIAGNGLQGVVVLLGWCSQSQMREAFSRSHVVLVPTTSAFVEGFNMVIAEAMLAGRPVITSEVCPALAYLPGAAVVVPPDDVRAYVEAILCLADDAALYRRHQASAVAAGMKFTDPATSYGAALTHTLGAIARGEVVTPRIIRPCV